jgi:hypothetical protein
MYLEQVTIHSFSVDYGKPGAAREPVTSKTNRTPHWWSWADIIDHSSQLGFLMIRYKNNIGGGNSGTE